MCILLLVWYGFFSCALADLVAHAPAVPVLPPIVGPVVSEAGQSVTAPHGVWGLPLWLPIANKSYVQKDCCITATSNDSRTRGSIY